jgi:hypothetical protein
MITFEGLWYFTCVPLLTRPFLWPWYLTYIMKTLTTPISCNSIFYDFNISLKCFLWQILLVGTNRFDLVTLTFMFDLFTENFNLSCIFWMDFDISHECSLRQDPPMGTNRFDFVTSTLMFDLHIENVNIGYNFSITCTRTWLHVTKPFHG